MEIFAKNDFRFISDFVEQKMSILKENKNFKKESMRLSDAIEELEQTLSEQQKEQLNEIIQLFYKTEEYYFAFSYYLGVKYGEELKKYNKKLINLANAIFISFYFIVINNNL